MRGLFLIAFLLLSTTANATDLILKMPKLSMEKEVDTKEPEFLAGTFPRIQDGIECDPVTGL